MNVTNPTPLTIITGFLGAGKTTLLNRILSADHGLRIAVLVNDFGAVNIDSQLVVNVEGETYSLSNGCICCTIRDDLVMAVRDALSRPESPEYIIIETSGVSDPLEVALTLRAVNAVAIDSILTVIDAEQIETLQRENAVLAMNQVGMADIVILNKVDLADADTLQRARQYIKRVIPNSRVIETSHCDVPLPLILNVGMFDAARLATRESSDIHVHEAGHQPDHHHTDHATVFSTWTWQDVRPVSLKALQRAIEQLPPDIYRVKGTLYLADKPDVPAILQVVGRRVSLSERGSWGGLPPHNEVVFIASAGNLDAAALQSRLEGCLAENAPRSEVERLTNAALEWLRRLRPGDKPA